jgi:ankyrin repeat protein
MMNQKDQQHRMSIWISVCCILNILGFCANGYSQDIHRAAAEGDSEKVIAFLEEDPEAANRKNQSNETPLILAAKYGQMEIVKLLISKGAHLNTQDNMGWAPLHYASLRSTEIARYLISNGADIDLKSGSGESPLFESINSGNVGMVKFLIAEGADVNLENDRGEMPLHRAAGEGDSKIVDLLLSHGARINTTTKFGLTPVHFAAVFGHKDSLERLIENGADLNIKSFDGGTPLHFAEAAGYQDITALLKTNGARSIRREYPLLEGEYFGLKKPARSPVLFATDILFNISIFVSMCFSPDGKEVYFSLASQHFNNSKIWVMNQKDGRWQSPKRASFSGDYAEGSPFLSPDGKRLFFYSDMPPEKKGSPKKGLDIWMVEREGIEWGEPVNLGPPVNTDRVEATSYVSRKGNLYFHRFDSRGTRGSTEIFRAGLDDSGNYSILERLDALNTEFGEACPYVSPDERFIIFHSNRPGGYNGLNDLYISFQKRNGTWGEPKNLGKEINAFPSMSAMVSPDGRYLFFTSMRDGTLGTYWVDAKIIEDLEPKELK